MVDLNLNFFHWGHHLVISTDHATLRTHFRSTNIIPFSPHRRCHLNPRYAARQLVLFGQWYGRKLPCWRDVSHDPNRMTMCIRVGNPSPEIVFVACSIDQIQQWPASVDQNDRLFGNIGQQKRAVAQVHHQSWCFTFTNPAIPPGDHQTKPRRNPQKSCWSWLPRPDADASTSRYSWWPWGTSQPEVWKIILSQLYMNSGMCI
jgi:hypothetical protein